MNKNWTFKKLIHNNGFSTNNIVWKCASEFQNLSNNIICLSTVTLLSCLFHLSLYHLIRCSACPWWKYIKQGSKVQVLFLLLALSFSLSCFSFPFFKLVFFSLETQSWIKNDSVARYPHLNKLCYSGCFKISFFPFIFFSLMPTLFRKDSIIVLIFFFLHFASVRVSSVEMSICIFS